MALDEEVLQSYVDRLLSLQAERADSLTSDELREVAYDLGLTDDDLAAAVEAAEKGLQRGRGFLQHGRLDDAVKELEAAAALAPEDADILYTASLAYRDRFRAQRRSTDRAAAERYARRCLDLDPGHDESYRLLNDLDHTTQYTAPAVESTPASRRAGLVVALLVTAVAMFIAIVLAWFLVRPAGPSVADVPATPVVAPTVVESASPSNVVSVPDVPAVPVEFRLPDGLNGLALKARAAKLDYYGDHGYFKLEGEIRNGSKLEIHELKAFVEVLDDAGKVVASDTSSILSDHEAEFRPGDVWVYDTLTRVAAPATKARVTIQDYDATPAGSYAKPKPVPVEWAFERPQDLQVSVGERTSAKTGSGYFATEFAITNTGSRPIKLMKFQMRYLDRAGQQLATRDFFLNITSQSPLPVGETWARSTINQVPDSFGGYELQVIEAQ